MYNMKKTALFLTAVLAVACMAAGCKGKQEKVDVSGAVTTDASQDQPTQDSDSSKQPQDQASGASEATQASDGSGSQGGGSATDSVPISTYKAGGISIQYPAISDTGNDGSEKKANELIKTNALSIISAYSLDENTDSLDVKCKVVAMDHSRFTVIYTGTMAKPSSADPVNIFYSNTVDLGKASNITFSQFADAYTMAGYVRSDDCRFAALERSLSDSQKASLMEAKNQLSMEQYTALFRNADFPMNPDADSLFPGTFSYEVGDTIFFSIPVSHSLGDYAIVAYSPQTK